MNKISKVKEVKSFNKVKIISLQAKKKKKILYDI